MILLSCLFLHLLSILLALAQKFPNSQHASIREMTQSDDFNCRARCCNFVLTTGITAFFMWLSFRPKKPTCSIEHFAVFALNTSANSSGNHTIYFDLKLKNNIKDDGIYYDALNLTFYYRLNRTYPLANFTIPEFYQGHQKTADWMASVEAKGMSWEKPASAALAANGTAVFRVDLRTAVRYKIVFWKTSRHRLEVGADLGVDTEGSLVRRKGKGVKLSSGAGTPYEWHPVRVGILVLLGLIQVVGF